MFTEYGMKNPFPIGLQESLELANIVRDELMSFSEKITPDEEVENLEDPHFDGDAVDPILDSERLTKGILRVFRFMLDGKWHTTTEIARGAGVPENSASAHYRSLRKNRWGAHTVERMRVTDAGLFKYRLMPNVNSMTYTLYFRDAAQ